MTQSQENEFGDKNNLETGPNWGQFGEENGQRSKHERTNLQSINL